MAAVVRIFGTILLTEGPGLSARRRKMESPPASGTSAIMNTSTPMPPSRWVKLRQKSRLRGRLSTSSRMLEPVVVKPETVSNTASR